LFVEREDVYTVSTATGTRCHTLAPRMLTRCNGSYHAAELAVEAAAWSQDNPALACIPHPVCVLQDGQQHVAVAVPLLLHPATGVLRAEGLFTCSTKSLMMRWKMEPL
jgi:hypothetical protein